MLEALLGGHKGSNLFLDISFEDAAVGSTDMYDKVSKKNLSTKRSTTSGTTESTVVNHATYGKVMAVNNGRCWWLPVFPVSSLSNLIIEAEFSATGASSESPLFATGGSLGNSQYSSGIMYTIGLGTYGHRVAFYPDNSGSSIALAYASNVMRTSFVEHSAAGTTLIYGARGLTPVSGSYNSKPPTGFYLFTNPWGALVSSAFSSSLTGFLKSIKIYKK